MLTAKGVFATGILAMFICQIAGRSQYQQLEGTWDRYCKARYEALSAQISLLPAAVGSLIYSSENSIVDLINNRTNTLYARIDVLQAEFVALAQLINTSTDAINATLGKIIFYQSAITADLQTKLSALQAEVQAAGAQLSSDFYDLENAIVNGTATLSSEISGLANETANLSTTIDANYVAHKTALSNHEALVDGKQDQLEALVDSGADEIMTLFNTSFQGLGNTCTVEPPPTLRTYQDCTEILNANYTESGVYTVYPTGFPNGVDVLCDLDTDGGGWTIFQQRNSSDVDFNRTFAEYEDGFGLVTPSGNFWLGNKYTHAISKQGTYELRVDLTGDAQSGYEQRAAVYQNFSLGDAASFYTLTVGAFSFDSTLGSNPGDSLSYHNGMRFTTKDVDNDNSDTNCGKFYWAGWWYNSCHMSNLNGIWGISNTNYQKGPVWTTFLGLTRPMTYTRMMMRETVSK